MYVVSFPELEAQIHTLAQISSSCSILKSRICLRLQKHMTDPTINKWTIHFYMQFYTAIFAITTV